MRQVLAAIVFVSALSLCSYNGANAQDKIPEHEYQSLIRQATSLMLRSLEPSEMEKRDAEWSMALLLRKKDEVGPYIIAQLQDDKTPVVGKDLKAAHYGMVLWKLGPEYVRKLEPAVLQSKNEDARVAGTYILGLSTKESRKAREISVDLLVTVLKRDASPKVQAEAIRSLGGIRAVDKSELITGYIASEHAVVRRAAVGFCWRCKVPHAFKLLKDRLDVEKDPEVSFLLSWTLCKYPQFSASSLLKHDNPGIRRGALHYLSLPSVPSTREDYDAIVARLEKETDIFCKNELASCLFRWRDARCLKLWIDILMGKEDSPLIRGSHLKTIAASRLANLTGLRLGITDEDRKSARETRGSLYDRVAKEYDAWWTENNGRLKWNGEQRKFVQSMEE